MAMEALQILAWAIGLALVLFFLTAYRQFQVDLLRYRLFVARDELFKQAEQGTIDFNNPAYGMTRTTLNGMLRFAHEVSVFRFLSYGLAQKLGIGMKPVENYRENFRINMDGLSFEERRAILNAMKQAHIAIVVHVMTTSILFFWWVIPLAFFVGVAEKTEFFKRLISNGKKARERWSVIDGEANCIGDPHLCQ
jgi:hypothetical protein